jgi:hypothetical protein
MHRVACLLVAFGCAARSNAAGQTLATAPAPKQAPQQTKPEALKSERIKGLDRFERVVRLEAGVLCGLHRGQSPVCASDKNGASHAAAYEALDDVVMLQALGPGRCVLFGSGTLRCDWTSPMTALATIANPADWPVIRTDVVDFVISSTTSDARVYALDNERRLHMTKLSDDPKQMTSSIVATSVVSFGWRDWAGACAAKKNGDVVCSDPKALDSEMQPTGVHDASAVFDGGAVLGRDHSFTYVIDSWHAFDPWPKAGLDYEYQSGCVIDPRTHDLSCANTGGAWVGVTLPKNPVRFAPVGDLSCAKLTDGTTACWTAFVDEVRRLGAAHAKPHKPGAVLAK